MIKHPFWKNSQCQHQYLHRFKIVEEYPDYVLEVCQICNMRKAFTVIDGQLDNQSYMDWHLHSVLPPEHPMYAHEHSI